jgi:hypothetical protein
MLIVFSLYLLRLAAEVEATKKPRILKRDNEPGAVLMPGEKAGSAKKKRAKTKADYEALKSAAPACCQSPVATLVVDLFTFFGETYLC